MAQRILRRERKERQKERQRRRAAGIMAALFGLGLLGAAWTGILTVDRSITWMTARETPLQRFLQDF